MRPTRTALLVAATALTPALLLAAPAFAAGASPSASAATASTTPVTPTPATACPDTSSDGGTPVDELTEDQLRAMIEDILADENAGSSVRQAANKALDGTAADMRAFLETGCRLAQSTDDRVETFRILNVATQNGDRNVIEAATAAIEADTPEALREFLEKGYAEEQVTDDRFALFVILNGATQNGDENVIEGVNEALRTDTPEALSDFRWTGYRLAQATDDRLYIFTMLADPDISDAMRDAIQTVLSDDSPEALRHFRTVGQYEVDG